MNRTVSGKLIFGEIEVVLWNCFDVDSDDEAIKTFRWWYSSANLNQWLTPLQDRVSGPGPIDRHHVTTSEGEPDDQFLEALRVHLVSLVRDDAIKWVTPEISDDPEKQSAFPPRSAYPKRIEL